MCSYLKELTGNWLVGEENAEADLWIEPKDLGIELERLHRDLPRIMAANLPADAIGAFVERF